MSAGDDPSVVVVVCEETWSFRRQEKNAWTGRMKTRCFAHRRVAGRMTGRGIALKRCTEFSQQRVGVLVRMWLGCDEEARRIMAYNSCLTPMLPDCRLMHGFGI